MRANDAVENERAGNAIGNLGRKLIIFISIVVLRVGTRFIRLSTFLGQLFLRNRTRQQNAATRVWIDVGAHRGETTFEYARAHPEVVVYGFEPDLSTAVQRYGLLDNFIVLGMAVSDCDGFSDFHLNSNTMTSSLLPLDPDAMQGWRGVHTVRRVTVPTIRLDTFLNRVGIARVEYLKIDAQGHDLEVLRSLGDRIKDVGWVRVEVCAVEHSMYRGANNARDDVIAFMRSKGFELAESVPQGQGQEANLTFRRCAPSTSQMPVASAK